jgi:cytochrome P450
MPSASGLPRPPGAAGGCGRGSRRSRRRCSTRWRTKSWRGKGEIDLIATGTLTLLPNPAELARLRSQPGLRPGAVEELLRYSNPLNHATERFIIEPLEIGGVTIPARQWVLWRDLVGPTAIQPDSSARAGWTSAGRGRPRGVRARIHYCLGAPLARLEGEIASGALLSRFPARSLAVDPATLRWHPSSLIHGLEKLPVRPG